MILIDSSVLVAYGREEDPDHKRAEDLIGKIKTGAYGEARITDYIFDETVTVLLYKSKSLVKTVEFGDGLRDVIPVLETGNIAFETAWQIFKVQKNTKLSFTDCTIFAMAHLEGIRNIATFDSDFKKIQGFNIVDK